MAFRAGFLAALPAFLLLFSPGASTPCAAEPDFSGPSELLPLEPAALPPPIDDFERPTLTGEPRSAGSEREAREIPGAVRRPPEVDPWAEAFAESARLEARAPRPPEPAPYLVAKNRRAGAKGLWQFMPSTARRYGLRVDRWVDERLDPERATVAAAAYLRDLHAQFGSWLLAQAAYNAGETVVARAVRRTGSTDFWALARTGLLRRETDDFVPAIQAATLLARDPARYGFEVGDAEDPEVERVVVPAATSLGPLPAPAGVSAEMLPAPNPVLVRGVP